MKNTIFSILFILILLTSLLSAEDEQLTTIYPTTATIVNSSRSGYTTNGFYSIGRYDSSWDQGQNIYRTAYFFGYMGIPSDAIVSNVSLSISINSYLNGNYNTRITAVPPNILPTSSPQNIYNAVGGGSIYFDNLNYLSSPFEKTSASLKSAVQAAISSGNTFSLGALSVSENTNGSQAIVGLALSITWTPGHYTCTIKNSFNSGNVMVDNGPVSSGSTFNWPKGSTHPIAAIDRQYIQEGSNWYYRNYQNWSDPNGQIKAVKPQMGFTLTSNQNGTWVANFLKEYNLTFTTSFAGGTVTVNGSSYPSGYQRALEQNQSITFSAQSSYTVGGYYHDFINWTANGNTVTSPNTPVAHTNYVANYTTTLIEPQSFTGTTITDENGRHPRITWAASEAQDALGYHVYWRYGRFGQYSLLATVSGRSSTSFTDTGVNLVAGGELITYCVRTYTSTQESQNSPDVSYFGELAADTKTSNENIMFLDMAQELPTSFSLDQNYPNPFNPVTSINFALPTPETVRLAVYDILGHEVALLIDGERSAGYHTVRFDAGKLGSGIYFYKLQAGSYLQIKKMQLIK